MAAYIAYTEALTKAGVFAGVNRLRPSSTATTVHVANGRSQVLDGPYMDSKEQLGGLSTWPICRPRSHGQSVVRPQITAPRLW